ncbi:hypothetical protein FRC09_008764, partial [Ceratobasidium sp. 395]
AHFQSRAKVLIAWWNKALFPDHIEENSGAGGTNNGRGGMLALLNAEVERDAE